MDSRIKDAVTDTLFEAVLSLKDIEECYNFFEDICTISEIKSLAQRLQVAGMLKDKKTYTEVCEITGASTATISRVNRALNYGAGGYDTVLDRISKTDDKRQI